MSRRLAAVLAALLTLSAGAARARGARERRARRADRGGARRGRAGRGDGGAVDRRSRRHGGAGLRADGGAARAGVLRLRRRRAARDRRSSSRREFEAHLRATLGAGAETLTVALLPLSRDAMIDALVAGRVDVLAANLTVTPSRAERVDFADPMLRDVRELVVTGPAAPPVATLDDLAAVPLHVRPSSSYHEHLVALNAARVEAGAPPIWRSSRRTRRSRTTISWSSSTSA